MSLSHVDEAGRARMVDVGDKAASRRTAVAEGVVRMSAEAFALVRDNQVAKGDVLRIAEVAGTMGAKRTSELVPLCHPLPLEVVRVECTADPRRLGAVHIIDNREDREMEASSPPCRLPAHRVSATVKAALTARW